MPDAYTKVTHQSWGSRIKGSFKGIIVGLLLFVISFPLLFWNEGRAVKMHKSLEEGSNNVTSVSTDKINSNNEGELIHISGQANTNDTLSDQQFAVSETAIMLKRKVEMYQWKEETASETKKNLGGSTDTETTYSYKKTWSESLIDSSSFEFPNDHENPSSMPYETADMYADNVNVGAFQLSPALIQRISGTEKLPLTASSTEALPEDDYRNAEIQNGTLYIGNPSSPEIGDVRISFEVIRPSVVSIISVQEGDGLKPYQAKAGADIELLEMGEVSADDMFQNAIESNKFMTWILRFLGIFLMFLGLVMMLKPLSVLGDVVPFIGNIIGMGTSLLAGILAIIFSFITIAISWLFYRPLIGILLIAVSVAGITYIVSYIKKNKNKKPEPPAESNPE